MKPGEGAAKESLWGDVDEPTALKRYRTLVDALDEAVVHLDADGRFRSVDDAFVETTDRPREALVGEHLSVVMADEDAAVVERELADRMGSDRGGVATFEVALLTADGGTVDCELRLTLLLEDGSFQGVAGTVRPAGLRERRAGTASRASTAARSGEQTGVPGRQRATAGGWTTDDLVTTILAESASGVIVLDDAFDVAWADDTVAAYFGVAREDLVGRDKRRVVEGTLQRRMEDSEEFAEQVLATYDDNSYVAEFECHVTPGDGREERWLEHWSTPIESGRYAGGRVEVYTEVTDRKQSTDALQEAEAEFESLVDAVEEYAIFRLDTEGYVTSWNEGAKTIKDYETDDIVGEHFSRFYTESDRAAGIPERNLRLALEHGSVEDEGWRVRKDGSRFWANVTITAIFDDDGTHRGFLKVTRDMTDRHEREQELESELQRILGRISDGFFAVDGSFRFTHVNERAEELLDHSEAELPGTPVWDVFAGADELDEVETAFRTALNSQEPVEVDFHHDDLDFWAEANLYPSETGISVYFRDVTDRREYERQLETSNERLEQFAYAASHDLQEPLRMVSSYLQLVERRYADDLDAEGREFIEFAVDGADRMRDMIVGLLQYSRVNTRGDPFEVVDLDAVFADVRQDMEVKIDESGAAVTSVALPRVYGDPNQLNQLFQNLLDNAIEYSGDAPPRVHVSAEPDGDRWVVSVRDEGVGIEPADQQRVFEVFQSLQNRRDHHGTGIGLALCKRIVERHGGDVRVESEPGEGATFSVSLSGANGHVEGVDDGGGDGRTERADEGDADGRTERADEGGADGA